MMMVSHSASKPTTIAFLGRLRGNPIAIMAFLMIIPDARRKISHIAT
jgi:hypothetical protein